MPKSRDLLPYAAAALLVIPYLSLGMPFRWALMGQAAAVLAVTLALGLHGALADGAGPRLTGTPKALWWGAALWSLVAVTGAVVGLVAGNGPMRVAGQLLALLLLPLGLVAGRLAPRGEDTFRALSRALTVVAGAACLLHFGVWAVAALQGLPPKRLYLENSVSVAGAIPCAVVLLLALSPRPRWRGPLLAVFVLYLAGAGSRGAWLAAALGVVLLSLLTPGGPGRWIRSPKRALGMLAALLLGWLGLILWLEGPRRNHLASHLPGELLRQRSPSPELAVTATGSVTFDDPLRQRILGRRFEARPETTYRLEASFRGGDRGRAYVALRWLGPESQVLGRMAVEGRPSDSFRHQAVIGASPAGAVAGLLLVGCRSSALGAWEVGEVRVQALAPGSLASPLRQASYLQERLASLWRLPLGSRGRPPGSEAGPLDDAGRPEGVPPPPRKLEDWDSVEFRLAESAELWKRFRGAERARQLWGHGLGATFELHGLEFHYVHNFYAYLLFKLGWGGGSMILLAALLWAVFLLRRRRFGEPGAARAAAAAAVWLAYLAWGVTSPEILDFRLAPLFGLLFAAAAADGNGAARGMR